MGRVGVTMRSGCPDDTEAVAGLIEIENRRTPDRSQIRRRLDAFPSLVAYDGDRLVGFVYGRRFSPDIAELSNMLVAASHRRTGLGTAIAERILDELRAGGYRAVIGVNSWMHPGGGVERAVAARAFWQRRGWDIIFATGGSVVIAKWLPDPAGHDQPPA